MATNDLMTELQKDSIKLDDDSERKVGEAIGFGGAGQLKLEPICDVLIDRW